MTPAAINLLPQDRKVRGLRGAEECLALFPDIAIDTSIYAIAFAGGVLRVGKARLPRKRLAQHWRSAHGQVEWVHWFGCVSQDVARKVEARAAVALSSLVTRVAKSEWLTGDTDKAKIVPILRAVVQRCRDDENLWLGMCAAQEAASLRRAITDPSGRRARRAARAEREVAA